MGKQKFFGHFLRILSLFAFSWSLVGSSAGIAGEGVQSPYSSEERVILPRLPEAAEKLVAVELLSFENLLSDSDAWTLHIEDPNRRFSLDPLPQKKSIWALRSGEDAQKAILARFAIRRYKLLFVWSRVNATEKIRDALKQVTLIVKDDKKIILECRLGLMKILGMHHGYDRTHETPHSILHEYKISDLPARARIKLKVQSPYPGKLMEKTEKQRTVSSRKWLKVPFRFEEENLKRVKIGMHWMVERPKRNGEISDKVIVKQKLTYDIGSYKNLELRRQKIDQHLAMLQQKNQKENEKYKIHQRDLGLLQQNAAAVAGAAPGTQAWAKQTQLHNQIKSKQRVMRSAEKRVRSRLKDMAQLSVFKDHRLEATLLQLNNVPYPYQVVMETDGGDEVLVESRTWGITAEGCNPLIGKWQNQKKDWTMEVQHGKIINYINGNIVSQYPSRIDVVSPCATERGPMKMYAEVKKFRYTAYFAEYSDKGTRALMRREIKISKESPDIAHEVFTSYTKDWVTKAVYRYISPSGAVLTYDIGEHQEEVETLNLTWHKIE